MPNPWDPELLERLLDTHAATLELFAAQWTNAPADCVQEAFIQLMRQKELPRNVKAWLFRVVRNGAISMARASQRRKKHETRAADMGSTWFVNDPSASLDAVAVTETLQLLPNEQREVIVARLWGGLTFEQIADVVDASSSSVHRRYEAGLQALRERLDLSWLNNSEKS